MKSQQMQRNAGILTQMLRFGDSPMVNRIHVGLILGCLMAGTCFADLSEVNADTMYDPAKVLEIEIEIPTEEWDALRKQTRQIWNALSPKRQEGVFDEPFDYFKGSITINGHRHVDVGIRKKGFLGSLDDNRPSLKIKFDEYVEDQSHAGISNITLNNNKQDPSRLHQYFAYRMFQDAGIPAPRCNFARVRVNGKDLGIYTHVEPIKKPFLRRHFKESSGGLFEGTLVDFFAGWARSFEWKGDETERGDAILQRVIDALERDDEQTVQDLEANIHMDSFISYWAVEVLLGHWDGYAGNHNNFYIYHNPETDRLHFLPWGTDQIAQLKSPFWQFTPPQSVLANGRLCNYLYDVPEYRERYRARMRQLLDTIWKESELIQWLEEMDQRILPHETRRPDGYASNRRKLIQFITDRREQIMAELQTDAPTWDYLPQPPASTQKDGHLTLEFETTWNPSTASPGIVPSPSKMSLTHQGKQHTAVAVSTGAGPGGTPPMMGVPSIMLMGRTTDGTSYIASLTVPPERFVSGQTVPLNFESSVGVLMRIQGFSQFEFMGMLFGEVKLTEAGRNEGDTVRGTAELDLLSFSFMQLQKKP